MVGSQLQSREAVSSGTLRAGAEDDPPATASAIGVPQERVDPRILRIVERLFPGHHGLDFLARLLRCAQEKQHALTGIDQPEVSNVAVISAQSLRVLAKQLGLSYDTTEKYIVVFCQLHLLQKLRHRRQITLHFPLSCPELPEPEALDHLLECRPGKDTPRYRPKVRSFAQGVKRRFVLLQGEIAVAPGEKKGDSSGHLPSNLQQLLLSDIRQIIEQEVDFETGKRLLLAIEGVIRSRCKLGASLLSAQKGDSERTNEKDIAQVYTKKSPPGKQKGDSRSWPSHQQSLLSAQNGDSLPSEPRPPHSQKATSGKQKGDSFSQSASQKERLSAQDGNSHIQKGDSVANANEEIFPNVNVITIIESLTFNVSLVAHFCCKVLCEKPEKHGIYSKVFREVDLDSQAIAAALIFTLVHREDGSIRKPPAVFIQRCRDFHRQGIPEEVATLVQRYGVLTHAQLLEALRKKAAPPVASSSFVRSEATYRTPQSLSPLPNALTVVPLRIPLKAGGGMAYKDAYQLYSRIAHDLRIGLCRVGLAQLSDQTYVVLVDNTVTQKVNQVAFYSGQQWQMRSARLSHGSELFELEGQKKPRPLRQFLNKGGLQWHNKQKE